MGATIPVVSEPLAGEAWHCWSRPMARRVDRCMAPRILIVTSSKLDYLRLNNSAFDGVHQRRLTTIIGEGAASAAARTFSAFPPLPASLSINGPSLTPSAYAAECEETAAGDPPSEGGGERVKDCTHFISSETLTAARSFWPCSRVHSSSVERLAAYQHIPLRNGKRRY